MKPYKLTLRLDPKQETEQLAHERLVAMKAKLGKSYSKIMVEAIHCLYDSMNEEGAASHEDELLRKVRGAVRDVIREELAGARLVQGGEAADSGSELSSATEDVLSEEAIDVCLSFAGF